MANQKFGQNCSSPWTRVDRRIATLELIGADITAILSKTRIKQYKTYSVSDMEALARIVDATPATSHNLIPSASI